MHSSLRWAVVRGAALVAALLFAPSLSAEDAVYRYQTREGRELFTNAGRAELGAKGPTPLALPELTLVDFGSATAGQLQSLDRGVERAHEALQSGPRCDAIRASSRVPLRSFLLREYLREVAVTGALCAFALLALVLWGGRLKPLMPIPPLLGALYVGYATYARVDHRQSCLREGLRACSSELPEGHSTTPSTVKQRLESALSLQDMVDRAYAQRGAQADQVLSER